MPVMLQRLVERFHHRTGYWPQHVSVEEHSPQQTLKVTQYGFNGYNGIVTSFETPSSLSSSNSSSKVVDGSCSYFVAQMPLRGSAAKHWNKPKRRHPTCFDLETPNHWNDILLEPQTLLLQTGDSLWNWRSRISAWSCKLVAAAAADTKNIKSNKGTDSTTATTTAATDHTTAFLILKFYNLPPPESMATEKTSNNNHNSDSTKDEQTADGESDIHGGIDYDAFGFMGKPETSQCDLPMPPLEQVLTIIVTTSPIKSNPSTEVIEKTFDTFKMAGHDFAVKCRKVIVCDGCRRIDNETATVSRRHVNAKQAMRNGIVSETQEENYDKFKAALRVLCANAAAHDDDSPLADTHVEELNSRHGYGFALRHALRHCVTTPYVCVIQHDRTFMRPTPMFETMQAMWRHRYIKYVTISMRSNLLYRDLFIGKYGKLYHQEFDDMILRLPELNLDRKIYGPDGESAKQITTDNAKVRNSIFALEEKYKGSKQNEAYQDWLRSNPPTDPTKHQLSLTPGMLSFWGRKSVYLRWSFVANP